MEVNLNFVAEDYMIIPISKEKKQIIDSINDKNNEKVKQIIMEEIKDSNLALKGITRQDYYDIKIKKNEKKIKNNQNSDKDDKNYDYSVEIICKDKMKEEIDSKIKSCIEKEKILINKQNEFKKLVDNIKIDEKLLEKKYMSLIVLDIEEYDIKIINEIIPKILDYDNFIKEVENVEERLIKYRETSIIALCLKIYLKKISKFFLYLATKSTIILNNEKIFKFTRIFWQNNIIKIMNILYDYIIQQLSDKEIYKNNKEIYNEKLNYYKEICYLLPILKYFEEKQEKKIYEIEEDINLHFNENDYDQMSRVDSQIPRRNALNVTLDYLKKYSDIEEGYAMALRRSLLINQKKKVFITGYKRSSFLYD